jgi:hypothetical protein
MSVTRQGYKTAQDVYLLGGEVTIAGANAAGGAMSTNLASTDIMQPVDIQSHYQTTIQTHSGMMIAPSAASTSSWVDTNGFDRIALTLLNDAATTSVSQFVWSHDGTTQHGIDDVVTSTSKWKTYEAATKARYVRVYVSNSDTAAHTMSAWVYLKC